MANTLSKAKAEGQSTTADFTGENEKITDDGKTDIKDEETASSKNLLKDETKPKTIRLSGYGNLPVTVLSSLGPEIGSGRYGHVYLLEENPPTVIKLFHREQDFHKETRTYLYAKSLNNTLLLIPQFRGIYYMPPTLFGSTTLASRYRKQKQDDLPYLYCLAISKIEGETLTNLINNDAFPQQSSLLGDLKDFLEVGLEKLHEAGIVNGDISPSNIIVDPSLKKAYFVDFGQGYLENEMKSGFDLECDFDHRDLSDIFEQIDRYRRECGTGQRDAGTFHRYFGRNEASELDSNDFH